MPAETGNGEGPRKSVLEASRRPVPSLREESTVGWGRGRTTTQAEDNTQNSPSERSTQSTRRPRRKSTANEVSTMREKTKARKVPSTSTAHLQRQATTPVTAIDLPPMETMAPPDLTTPKAPTGFFEKRRMEAKQRQERALVRNKQLVQVSFDEGGTGHRVIEGEPYFHGFINREEVNFLLHKEGEFLVRKTELNGRVHYVLSVQKGGEIHHLLVRRTNTKRLNWVFNYAFKSVTDLILYHYRNYEPVDENMIYLAYPAFRAQWQLNHEQVDLKKKLGDGSFGVVHRGLLQRDPFEPTVEVAVKTLHSQDLSIQEKSKFLREANLMLALNHVFSPSPPSPFPPLPPSLHSLPFIVRMFGVAATRDPIMVVMELCDDSLVNRLEEHERHCEGEVTQRRMSAEERLNILHGAAKGLRYLHSLNIIHRDIAARNCLISRGEAKISDFGLSCIGTEHRERRMVKVPVRWTAPETLKRGQYSRASDVFSYGSLVYESFSFCRQPYAEIEHNGDVRKAIITGTTPLVPTEEDCPPWLLHLLGWCRMQKADQRPTFDDVVKYLRKIPGCRDRAAPILDRLRQWMQDFMSEMVTLGRAAREEKTRKATEEEARLLAETPTVNA